MRSLDKALRATLATTIGALALAAGTISASAPAQAAVTSRDPEVELVPLAAKPHSGWQTTAAFKFTPFTLGIELNLACPAAYPIVLNGAFAFNAIGTGSNTIVGANGPRIDLVPASYQKWGWHFRFPSGSLPGTAAVFSVYCV
jgi:hypothetical protein